MWTHPLVSLSSDQQALLEAYEQHLLAFNKHINLISRSDTAHFRRRHLWHCLSLGMRRFPSGASVVDWGTGGGLPGLPLAILFPDTAFHLVDATGKKVQAVRHMARTLGLQNVHPWHGRAEHWPGEAHFAVSRATAPLTSLWSWFERVRVPLPADKGARYWPPGLICLKGGDLSDETADLKQSYPAVLIDQHPLYPALSASYFKSKSILVIRSVGLSRRAWQTA